MKATLITVLTIFLVFLSGCETPVAIDPQSGQQQTARYQSGYFYAPLNAEIGDVFQTAIREMDGMGYLRTGELHKENHITIYARKVGDQKITVRTYYPKDAEKLPAGAVSMIRIRVGNLGNLPESQLIYARIRDSL
ncbi:MAG: DUF3568 family protein [Verrucomicrobiota bacterium]